MRCSILKVLRRCDRGIQILLGEYQQAISGKCARPLLQHSRQADTIRGAERLRPGNRRFPRLADNLHTEGTLRPDKRESEDGFRQD